MSNESRVVRAVGPDHVLDLPGRPKKVLFFGCTHLPHVDPRSFGALLERISDWGPDLVVHLGDVFDNHAISRHKSKRPKGTLVEDNARSEPWVERLGQAVEATPAGLVHVIMGNHDDWLERVSYDYQGLDEFLDYHQLMPLPDSWRVYANQTKLRLGGHGGPLFLHGDILGRVSSGGVNPANTLRRVLKTHAISAHFHRRSESTPEEIGIGGSRERRCWTVGWFGDPKAPEYISSPDWTTDFGEMYFSGPDDFEVNIHSWDQVFGRFLIDGKRYR